MITDSYALHAHLVRHLYRHGGQSFLFTTLNAVVLVLLLASEAEAILLGAWFIICVTGAAYHWRTGARHLSLAEKGVAHHDAARLAFATGVAGLGFGAAAAFLPALSASGRSAVLAVLCAQAAAGLPRLSALPLAYAAHLTGVLVPAMIIALTGTDAALSIPIVLGLLTARLGYAAREVHRDLVDLLFSRFGLEHKANEDKLTGVPNRRYFDERLAHEWRRAAREGVPLSVVLVDVDLFKKFNDRYGHQSGDECLSQVAKALSGAARRAGDFVARYGGEEFVALLYHTTRDDGYALAERLRASVAALGIIHEDSPHGFVTASFGGATVLPTTDGRPETLVEAADQALYRAKGQGRNRVAWQRPVEHCATASA